MRSPPIHAASSRTCIAASDGALTGPVARGDTETVGMHLEALEGTPLAGVYQAFIAAAGRERA